MNEKITIITVCYNAATTIQRTVSSVLALEYDPLEYIIIDGVSTDNTMDILNSYKNIFKKSRIQFFLLSQPDTGIYNAMNKAVKIASGDWIIFMNADDYFCSANVFCRIKPLINNTFLDIIYGDEYIFSSNNKNLVLNKRTDNIGKLRKTLPFCHQSSLVRRKWLEIHPFDESLEVSADYEFFLFCYFNAANFFYCGEVIAAYYCNGTSRKKYSKAINETYNIKCKYGILNSKNIIPKIKKELRKIYIWVQLFLNVQ